MQVAARRPEAPMAEQELDPPQIDAGFEEMRRKGMTQHMRMDRLREAAACPGVPADQIHRLRGHGARAGMAGKEPGLRLVLLPILP